MFLLIYLQSKNVLLYTKCLNSRKTTEEQQCCLLIKQHCGSSWCDVIVCLPSLRCFSVLSRSHKPTTGTCFLNFLCSKERNPALILLPNCLFWDNIWCYVTQLNLDRCRSSVFIFVIVNQGLDMFDFGWALQRIILLKAPFSSSCNQEKIVQLHVTQCCTVRCKCWFLQEAVTFQSSLMISFT